MTRTGIEIIFLTVALVGACQLDAQDVLTQRNDTARTGAQLYETVLKPGNVTPATFGRLYERAVDGQIIAQPLYANNLLISGKSRNVVFVATRKNWVYAFDADNTNPDPDGLLWKTLTPIEPAGAVPHMCSETIGPMGITSTPVIDRATGTMYVVARNADGTILLHALDITTGKPKTDGTPGSVPIGPVTRDGITFDKSLELNRAGLLLQNGVLFLAFSALNCDNARWHGWVLAYRVPSLTLADAFVTTHSDQGGGVWQSGNGLASDGAGNIYFNTGNGPAGNSQDLGQSIVKLHMDTSTYKFSLAGYHTASNFATLNFGSGPGTNGDTDLGSGGPTLLPGNRLVSGGKEGKLYELDTSGAMSLPCPPAHWCGFPPGFDGGYQAFINTWHDDPGEVACTNGPPYLQRPCYMAHQRYQDDERTGPNIHGGMIYWDGANPSYGLIYGMPEKDYLRAFKYDHSTLKLDFSAPLVGAVRSPDGMPGSALSLSANGNTSGIIWASVPKSDGQYQNVPGSLVAFDALTLKELWRDDDHIGFAKFTPPTIAGGKVFRPTFVDKLIVYGLTTTPSPTPCYNIARKYGNYTGPDGILGNPTTTETVAPDGTGHFEHFQGGSIYWTPSTCAHEVHGSIQSEWAALGWERSFLGYPTTDESVTPDGIGRYNHFQGGSIYWTPLTGAHEVHGLIRAQWATLGWELSALGYPISDETDEINGSGRFSLFEHGSIHWNRSTGAITVNSNTGVLMGLAEGGFDRLGSDFMNVALPAANPAMCQQQCADNSRCRAWTYASPGVRGPQAQCWLKDSMPLKTANTQLVSGLKVDIHPTSLKPPQGEIDLVGSDFASFSLPAADFRLCQGECAGNSSCRAWAYAEPSTVLGNNTPAQCWLKNAIPAAAPNNFVISGSK